MSDEPRPVVVSVQDRTMRDEPRRAHLSAGVLVDRTSVIVLVDSSVGRIDRSVALDAVVVPLPLAWNDVVERIPVTSVLVFEDGDRAPRVLGLELSSHSRYGREPRSGRVDGGGKKKLRASLDDPRRELEDVGAIPSEEWKDIPPEELDEIARHERGQLLPQWHTEELPTTMRKLWPFCLWTRGGC